MRHSIATVSLGGDLAEKLEAIARAGFAGVEIFENDMLAFDRGPAEVGRMVRDAGLTVTLFQPFRDFEGLPEPLRARAFARARRKFAVMRALGAELMLVCSSVAPQAEGGIDRAAADLHALGALAAAEGLRIGYEALAWGRFVNDHRDAWEIVRRAGHPAVGLILDSFHTLARGIPVESIRAIPADRLFLVQLADAPRLDLDPLSWSRHFRCMPGQGELPLDDFVRAVAATGSDGWLSLEIFNDQFRAGAARGVAVDGKRALVFLQDRLGLGAPGAAPLPPRAPVQGIEFVEFAVDAAAAPPLEALFAALGFRLAARHRSKEVRLWRQGAINLLVNCDAEGFAHAYYNTHGPAVCALCLRVADAQAALARARALQATPFRQAVEPGELDVPAIRGVGGSLLYFVDGASDLGRLWSIDFEVVAPLAPALPGDLVAIDHVAQSMDYDEMLSWLLFYRAILAVEATPGLEIADPGGLTRSQVVQDAAGRLRLVLNASQSQRTLSGRFVSEFFGSGVQHIAFASDDIRATARRLRAAGLAPLPIPANYYEDLAARFGLADALLAELAAEGILYDRDSAGEYFQLYTPTFAERFFFEIVERRAYAGFGAANAPIRLAAQARRGRHPAVPRG